jgi:hypothetical protein
MLTALSEPVTACVGVGVGVSVLVAVGVAVGGVELVVVGVLLPQAVKKNMSNNTDKTDTTKGNFRVVPMKLFPRILLIERLISDKIYEHRLQHLHLTMKL